MTAKYPLCAVTMELSAQTEQRGVRMGERVGAKRPERGGGRLVEPYYDGV